MRKFLIFSVLICFFTILFADIYKDELKKTEKDKKMVAIIEKRLATDEKDCENPSGKNLDKSVAAELEIYCGARESLKSRIPEIKRLLAEYESVFREYSETCRKIDDDEKYEKCADLDRKMSASAEALNNEKKNFNKSYHLLCLLCIQTLILKLVKIIKEPVLTLKTQKQKLQKIKQNQKN